MKADRFAAHVGVRLTAVRPGYARATLRLRPHHLNGVSVVQGGATLRGHGGRRCPPHRLQLDDDPDPVADHHAARLER
jgi:hypothetical protein